MTNIRLHNDFAKVTTVSLNKSESVDDFEGLNIVHARCQASVSLYGGQVLSFKPSGHKDVLWLSEKANYQVGKAIRGGVPLCWPWFGFNDKQTPEQQKEKVAANHGFARQLPWQLESIEADEKGVTLVLTLTGENQHPLWPNAYQLTQTLFFGESFKQSLAMSNLSRDDAQYSAALHSYFTVSNPSNITIDALTGVNYIDKLTETNNIQQHSVSCVGEIDREYLSSEKMTLVDSDWLRKIEVISHHCKQWVLWNPGAGLASTMADVHPKGEQEYVCLEAANTDWQALPAGETVTISQEVIVTKF